MQGQGTHLGLQLLLLPADLLLRLLIELPHLVKMVRVSPVVTRGGTRQPLRTSGPLCLGSFCLTCPQRSWALSGHPGSMTLVIPLWISPPPTLSMVLIVPTLYPHRDPQSPSRPHNSGQVCDPDSLQGHKTGPWSFFLFKPASAYPATPEKSRNSLRIPQCARNTCYTLTHFLSVHSRASRSARASCRRLLILARKPSKLPASWGSSCCSSPHSLQSSACLEYRNLQRLDPREPGSTGLL